MSQTSGLHDGISGDRAAPIASRLALTVIAIACKLPDRPSILVGARLLAMASLQKSQSNSNNASRPNCASNPLAGIGLPNKYP